MVCPIAIGPSGSIRSTCPSIHLERFVGCAISQTTLTGAATLAAGQTFKFMIFPLPLLYDANQITSSSTHILSPLCETRNVIMPVGLCFRKGPFLMNVAVALLQMTSCGSDQAANLTKGEDFCRRALNMGADIALFPEMWNIGYTPYFPAEQEPCDIWRSQVGIKERFHMDIKSIRQAKAADQRAVVDCVRA